MGLHDDGEISKLPSESPRLGQTTGSISISSLYEAWFHTLDSCVVESPLSEVILPLMRNCFFGGAMHAVFLLQKGHGDQLAIDIAGFIKESRSANSQSLASAAAARNCGATCNPSRARRNSGGTGD